MRRGEEPADHDDGQRRREEGALAEAERHRQQGEDGRDRGHEDGTQAAPAALDDRRARVHALAAELLDEVEQHDGVGHDDADQHEQADEARHAQAGAGDEEQDDGADGGERDADQQDERVQEAAEGRHHDDVDDQDGDQHGDARGCGRRRSSSRSRRRATRSRRRASRPCRARPGCRSRPRRCCCSTTAAVIVAVRSPSTCVTWTGAVTSRDRRRPCSSAPCPRRAGTGSCASSGGDGAGDRRHGDVADGELRRQDARVSRHVAEREAVEDERRVLAERRRARRRPRRPSAWSTMTVADGRPSLRFEVTSARPSTLLTASRTVVVGLLEHGRVGGRDLDLDRRAAAHRRRPRRSP